MTALEVVKLFVKEVRTILPVNLQHIRNVSYNEQQKRWRVEIIFEIINKMPVKVLCQLLKGKNFRFSPVKLAIPGSFSAIKMIPDEEPSLMPFRLPKKENSNGI